MKVTASIAGLAVCAGVTACGAVLDSGATPKEDGAVCVETVPPFDNTAEFKPDAPATTTTGGGS